MGFDQLLAFLAGFLLNMGGCAQPALDISPPAPAPQIELALPVLGALQSLDEKARTRVFWWTISRLDLWDLLHDELSSAKQTGRDT